MGLISAQVEPVAATLTDLYTATSETVVSSILICNKNTTNGTFRIAIRLGGALISNAAYIYYDVLLSAKDTFIATIGLTLPSTSVISVYSSVASINFHVFGESV